MLYVSSVKYLACAILLALYCISCIAQGANPDKIKNTYYVSSSLGDDKNDGLSESFPLQHIYAISQKENACIKLKCGDVFYEQLHGFGGCLIESFGKGAKPVLCGFRVVNKPEAWYYDKNYSCWKLNLRDTNIFSGFNSGDVPEQQANNIGFIYDAETDKVYGHMVGGLDKMSEEGDFFVSSTEDGIVKMDDFRFLWWKTNIDPRGFSYLCIPMAVIGVKKMFSCTIRNLAVIGFNFGFTNCHHSIIEDCQIDLIGGSIHVGAPKWVRYGNGIEFWGNTKNCIVRDCLISRTYDCGVTIQGNGYLKTCPENIHIVGNRFYHCRQAFEFWLNYDGDYKPDFVNCSFTDNMCVYIGDNSFNTPEARDANLLTYDWEPKSVVIRNNIFFGSNYFYGMHYPKNMSDNVVYLFEGQYLSYANVNYKPIIVKKKKDLKAFQIQSNDDSTVYIMKRGSRKAGRKEKELMDKLKWECVNLNLND